MLRKFLSAALVGTMSFLTCFAQTAAVAPSNTATTPKTLSHADFYKVEPLKFNFEKESVRLQTKKNNFSGGAKTALWVALFAAGVVTVIVLATRNKEERSNSPCGIGVTTPCPIGCVCAQ